MRTIALVLMLSACGGEQEPEPDTVELAPPDEPAARLECETTEDVGQLVPIPPEPGIEPCNGTTPFCQRFMCYECQETQPSFFDWVAVPSCDG